MELSLEALYRCHMRMNDHPKCRQTMQSKGGGSMGQEVIMAVSNILFSNFAMEIKPKKVNHYTHWCV